MLPLSSLNYVDIVSMAVEIIRSEHSINQKVYPILRHLRSSRTNLRSLMDLIGEKSLQLYRCSESGRLLGIARTGSKRYIVMKRFCSCLIFQNDVASRRLPSCKHETAFRLLSAIPPSSNSNIIDVSLKDFNAILLKQSQMFLIAEELRKLGNPKNIAYRSSDGEFFVSSSQFAHIGVDTDCVKSYYREVSALEEEHKFRQATRKNVQNAAIPITAAMFIDDFAQMNAENEKINAEEMSVFVKRELVESAHKKDEENHIMLSDSEEEQDQPLSFTTNPAEFFGEETDRLEGNIEKEASSERNKQRDAEMDLNKQKQQEVPRQSSLLRRIDSDLPILHSDDESA